MIYFPLVSSKIVCMEELYLLFIVFGKAECSNKSESVLENFFHSIYFGTARCGPFSITIPKFFIRFSKKNYETKYKYANVSTSPCSPFESVTQYETPEEFCKTWRLVIKRTKTEQMLFNTVKRSAKYSFTNVAKVLGVQLDPQLKFRSHFNHLTAFNLFTWNNFKCILNRGIKPTSRLNLFNVYFLLIGQ